MTGPPAGASVRREVLLLIVLVLVVDAIFIGVFFLAHILTMQPAYKVGYTLLWTLLTLAVVVRGLNRIRRARGVTIRLTSHS